MAHRLRHELVCVRGDLLSGGSHREILGEGKGDVLVTSHLVQGNVFTRIHTSSHGLNVTFTKFPNT